MSDTTADNGQRADKQRTLASLAAAFVLHGVLLAALALGVGIASGPAVTPPVTIDLQYSAAGMDAPAGSGGSDGALPGGGENSGTAFVGPAATGPAASAAEPSAPAAAGGQGSDSAGFVIPTPRGQPSSAPAASAGPAFREAGGRTGVVQGIPSVPGPVPAPAVAPVQQGRGAGSAPSSGAGASSVQRGGTGVLVAGSSGPASSGKLDLSQLDKSLAGAGGTGAGKPGGASPGSGGTASAGSAGGSASGGTGAGSGGGGGTGSGGSEGDGGSGAGAGGGQSYSVSWEGADAGKGRTLISKVLPKVPAWVGAQGLTLSVTMSFSVLPDGLVTGVATQQSSGYADIDSAVIDALRQWRYSPSAGALLAKGRVSFVIRAR